MLIDPQLQGLKWIRKKYELLVSGQGSAHGTSVSSATNQLVVLRTTQKNWLQTLIQAISAGRVVLLEGVGESLDPVLDPLLSRSIIRRPKSGGVPSSSESHGHHAGPDGDLDSELDKLEQKVVAAQLAQQQSQSQGEEVMRINIGDQQILYHPSFQLLIQVRPILID